MAFGLAAGVFLAISAHVLFLTADFLMAVLGVLVATILGVFALAAEIEIKKNVK